MADEAQKDTLLNTVASIRAAELLLLQASRASSDPVTLIKINTEYSHLDSLLSQLLHAQAIADDADFANAVTALKQQAAGLQVEEDDIKKIVANVAAAAEVAGYMAQAASLIATL